MRAALACAALLLSACMPAVEPPRRALDLGIPPSPVAPTAFVLAGLRAEARGDTPGAVGHYERALAEAKALYGVDHPNTSFAHAALGVWHARYGGVGDALEHFRASRRIDEGRGQVFVNIAETRLPADASDPIARALRRVRLQRDLVLCAQDGGCSLAWVLGLAEALGEVNR